MARLVAAFGTSHSPALASPAEDMPGHARRDEMYAHHLDREGNRVSYAQLLETAPAGIDLSPETQKGRVAACERHLDRLSASLADAKLDALLVVGDDQREQYFEDNMPAFLVYAGASIVNSTLDLPAGAPEYWKRARSAYHEPSAPREYPVARDLALHLLQSIDDFDLAYAEKLAKPRGEGHAFGFVHRRLMGSGIVPIVPLVVNTYYPPNQPRPKRCFALGRAIAQAISRFGSEQRVGILASGGLSHFTIDEELDQAVLQACAHGDERSLASIAPARLNSGNSEIRNWIVMAGAAAGAGLRCEWREYVPLYRTPAGTGCGMAFACLRAKEAAMAGIPRNQGRAEPKIGPSDSSDSPSDRPNTTTDTDDAGTGERRTVGKVPRAKDIGTDRVADEKEVGLGGGLDQAEEARLKKPKP
jgi:3-O-methylgallate 3,4-dioxygenase